MSRLGPYAILGPSLMCTSLSSPLLHSPPLSVIHGRQNPTIEAGASSLNDVVSTPSVALPEELVAKVIDPVKREFLCPPSVRPSYTNNGKKTDLNDPTSTPILKEKKSTRQLKRERREWTKSL